MAAMTAGYSRTLGVMIAAMMAALTLATAAAI
jgi:hypothetical protein